jgi:hypothetical protein
MVLGNGMRRKVAPGAYELLISGAYIFLVV